MFRTVVCIVEERESELIDETGVDNVAAMDSH